MEPVGVEAGFRKFDIYRRKEFISAGHVEVGVLVFPSYCAKQVFKAIGKFFA